MVCRFVCLFVCRFVCQWKWRCHDSSIRAVLDTYNVTRLERKDDEEARKSYNPLELNNVANIVSTKAVAQSQNLLLSTHSQVRTFSRNVCVCVGAYNYISKMHNIYFIFIKGRRVAFFRRLFISAAAIKALLVGRLFIVSSSHQQSLRSSSHQNTIYEIQ